LKRDHINEMDIKYLKALLCAYLRSLQYNFTEEQNASDKTI
jgi:hypothetical protein